MASEQRKASGEPEGTLSLWDLFLVFLKAGLAFGGGPGIMVSLEEELVRKRGVVTSKDFQATYALARIVPSGTMSAVAVALGHRFRGWLGGLVAVTALVLPSGLITILATLAYGFLRGPALGMLSASLLPAALGFILLAAIRVGKDVFACGWDFLIAATACAAAFGLGVHPGLLLLGGSLAGWLVWARSHGLQKKQLVQSGKRC